MTKSTEADTETKSETSLALFFTTGVVVTLLLLLGTFLFERSYLGPRYESLAYEVLHSRLSPLNRQEPLPVVVVDISKVPGGKDSPTSGKVIGDILSAIAAQKPRAIGVDLDWSPTKDGWRSDDDPDFFNRCLAIRARGVPIYLGIARTAAEPPQGWLGVERYQELAAGILVREEDTLYVPRWISNGKEAKLPALSFALAEASSQIEPLPEPPKAIAWALEEPNEPAVKTFPSEEIRIASTLVNYSKLEEIQRETLLTISPQSIREAGDRFTNRIVILGDANPDLTGDKFYVPGRGRLVPGVFLHASAVNTLVKEPLYEFSHIVRFALDLALAFAILFLIAIIRHRKKGDDAFDWHALQPRYCYRAAVGVVVAGVILIWLSSIVWLDFLLVAFALALHPAVERIVHPHIERTVEKHWIPLRDRLKERREKAPPTENPEKPA